MTRLEAEFVRREAPPSYGQLIAQGLIPPVEDFPVYSASQVSPSRLTKTRRAKGQAGQCMGEGSKKGLEGVRVGLGFLGGVPTSAQIGRAHV